MKQLTYGILSLLLTLSLAWYFFRTHSFTDVMSAIKNVPLPYIISFFCFSSLMSIFRSWRYHLLLQINGFKAPPHSLFLITIVRNLFADLLPARLGTLMYVYLVRTRIGIPLHAGTSSFAYSFLFDLIGNCPIILFCVLSFKMPEEINRTILILAVLALLLVTIITIFLLPFMITIGIQITERIKNDLAEKITTLLIETKKSIKEVQKARMYDRILILSVGIRIFKYAGLYVFLLGLGTSLGLDPKMLIPGVSLLGLLTAEFAASLPISGIAGFGAYEGAWAYTFSLLGIDLRMAEMTAFSHHLFTQAYGYSIGIISLLILLVPYFYRSEQLPRVIQYSSAIRFYVLLTLTAGLGVIFAVIPLSASSEKSDHIISVETSQISIYQIGDPLPDIIFDSNRDGTFGIYGLYLATNTITQITSSASNEMFPDISPNKEMLVFSRQEGLSRTSPSVVVLYSLKDGTEKIISNGVFPTFSNDSSTIYFEQNRSKVMSYSIKEQSTKQVFPDATKAEFGPYKIVKPRISPEGNILTFTSDKGGRWHAWGVNLDTHTFFKIGHGCEPVIHPDGRKIIWVSETGMKERSGFKAYSLPDQSATIYHDEDAPWGHEYFPSFSKDGSKFIFSASPPSQHSHESAHYQLFLLDTETKQLTRLTNDQFTNRWGKFVK
jgi:uncharacterized protein (TIRG00374 family)